MKVGWWVLHTSLPCTVPYPLIYLHHWFSFSCLHNCCGQQRTRVLRLRYCTSTSTSFPIRSFAVCAMAPSSSLPHISPWYWSKPSRFANRSNITGINRLKDIALVKILLISLLALSISPLTLSLLFYRCLWFSTYNWFYQKRLPSLQCLASGRCKITLSLLFLCRLQSRLLTIITLTRICVISLLRVIWLWTWNLADMTYNVTPGAIYSVLEPNLGVVNACLPTIKPAVNQLFGSYVLLLCYLDVQQGFLISILKALS